MTDRATELRQGLDGVRDRLRRAAQDAGRDSDDVTLIVVTKTWPASDVELLHGLGVRHVGESRHQEAAEKARALSALPLSWHFVGQVQSNKAAKIAEYADVVHSVDSVRVAKRLTSGAHHADRRLDCFVQVDLDRSSRDTGRGGVPVGDDEALQAVAEAVATGGRLWLAGVMAVPPLGADPRAAYDDLAAVSARIRELHPAATAVSAGMSGDVEAAVAAGATHVRVGSAILGKRPPLG